MSEGRSRADGVQHLTVAKRLGHQNRREAGFNDNEWATICAWKRPKVLLYRRNKRKKETKKRERGGGVVLGWW